MYSYNKELNFHFLLANSKGPGNDPKQPFQMAVLCAFLEIGKYEFSGHLSEYIIYKRKRKF